MSGCTLFVRNALEKLSCDVQCAPDVKCICICTSISILCLDIDCQHHYLPVYPYPWLMSALCEK